MVDQISGNETVFGKLNSLEIGDTVEFRAVDRKSSSWMTFHVIDIEHCNAGKSIKVNHSGLWESADIYIELYDTHSDFEVLSEEGFRMQVNDFRVVE